MIERQWYIERVMNQTHDLTDTRARPRPSLRVHSDYRTQRRASLTLMTARASLRVKRQRVPSNGFTSETTVDSGVRLRTELRRGNAETRRRASAAIKSAGKTRLTQKCGALSMRFRWVCLCSAALCGSVQAGSVFS